LKNLSHAVVDRPWRCHASYCDPYIADIVSIPGVRDKLRLHLLDAVMGVAVGGPDLESLNHLLVEEKLLVSTDPVALDSIGRRWIDRVRTGRGLPPVAERRDGDMGEYGTPASYIATAESRNLGNAAPDRIDRVEVEIPS
jgi:hypothetical protein